jgi:tetratricopeptide (TPR) repeat protein
MDRIRAEITGPPYEKLIPYGYVMIYLALERPDQAEAAIGGVEEFIEAFAIEALRADVNYARARVAEFRGEFDVAIDLYFSILESNPGAGPAYLGMGRCQRELGRHDDARENLLKALKLSPFSAQTNYELALLYHATGDMTKAREHLDRTLMVWESADESYQAAAKARATREEWDASANM